jgi:hypothetical protein
MIFGILYSPEYRATPSVLCRVAAPATVSASSVQDIGGASTVMFGTSSVRLSGANHHRLHEALETSYGALSAERTVHG